MHNVGVVAQLSKKVGFQVRSRKTWVVSPDDFRRSLRVIKGMRVVVANGDVLML